MIEIENLATKAIKSHNLMTNLMEGNISLTN
jgi:hypothetical protein